MAISTKVGKGTQTCQLDLDEISALMILDYTNGSLTKKLKEACSKFKSANGISVTVRERAGTSIRSDAKSEPLRQKGCNRIDFLKCYSGKGGMCETNSVVYRIHYEACLGDGQLAYYEGENGRNAYTLGLEHSDSLKN